MSSIARFASHTFPPSLTEDIFTMIPIPAGCARFLCYGWIITGVIFVLGLNKNGEDLSGAGLLAIGLGVLGLYVTRPRKD
ncbi:MAG: hypothetical protein JW395_0509 [Nitrospira sp.]|nr:hypothetical protein [Nitrospira sp.]